MGTAVEMALGTAPQAAMIPTMPAAILAKGSCGREADPERETLILKNLPLVQFHARQIHKRLPNHVRMDDLISAGVVGLIEAIDRYDAGQKASLRTFADRRVRGAILDSFREADGAPRRMRRESRAFETAAARLEQKLGRAPEEIEIARELNLTIGEYRRKALAHAGLNSVGLDFVVDDRVTVIEKYASPEPSPEEVTQRTELQRMIASFCECLPRREKTVLSLYYIEELSMKEIAGVMRLSMSRIAHIKMEALQKLRAWITDAGVSPETCFQEAMAS